MKILQSSEYLFKKSGILLDDRNVYKSRAIYFLGVFLVGPVLCSATAFYVYRHTDDIAGTDNAIMIHSAALMCFGTYVLLGIHSGKLDRLILNFRNTVEEGKSVCVYNFSRFDSDFLTVMLTLSAFHSHKAPDSKKHFYEQAETKGRTLTSLLIRSSLTAIQIGFGLLPFGSAVYNIATGKLDTRQWIHLFNIE